MIQSIKNIVTLATPSAGGVYESARLNDNIEGTGGVTVSWVASENNTLPVGTSITVNGTKYTLLDPYAPVRNTPTTFRYEPTFLHPLARLSRVPFYISSRDSQNNVTELHTISFTGLPGTIIQYLADFFTSYGSIDAEFGETFGTWTYAIGSLDSALITVDFDGCSIRSAATRIADAIGCNVFFDWSAHVIRFIAGTTIEGEYYNCFRVLGGTKNMAKKTVQGAYAAITQRLTLDNSYPGSMMYRDNGGRPSVLLTRDLIFDNIYPKLELYIRSARERRCYLTDESGEKIVDHYNGETPVYKEYSKWYVTLSYANGNQYFHNENSGVTEIQDKTLALLFQPDYANTQVTCPLAGRQFDLVYFNNSTPEWESDDVLPETNPFTAAAGEFRIIFTAEGNAILPSTHEQMLTPNVGNKVTLVNVALDDTFKAIAQEELRVAALEVIALMSNDAGQYTRQVADYGKRNETRVLGSPETVDGHSGVITNISADLDTGVADITIGSWSRKTLTGGMRDKIDTVTSTIVGGEGNEAGMSKNQFDALWHTTKKGAANNAVIDGLVNDVQQIKRQSDSKFNIIFGIGDPTTANNPPEEDWTTDDMKNEHVGDIYYDTNKEPASTGGRAWRWTFHAAGTTGEDGTNYNYDTWQWEEITDKDTLLSLEKIRDVASDGILSGGTEKTRIFIEWKSAADEYIKLYNEAGNYNLTTERTALETAYNDLWRMLNGGVAMGQGDTYMTVPLFLSNLATSTALADYTKTGITGDAAMDADWYRLKWSDFYSALSSLTQAITGQTRLLVAEKASFFVSDTIPTPPYSVGDMWLKTSGATSADGELYECKISRASGTGDMSEWRRVSNFGVSLTNLLATIYIKCESEIKRMFAQTGNPQFLLVQIGGQSSYTAYTIFYDTDYYSSGQARLYFGGVDSDGNPVGYNSPLFDDFATLKVFEELYRILGECQLYIWKELSGSASLYDICGKRSSFTDSFTKQTIEGELAVWVRGETSWVQAIEHTEGILQNYGDHIVAAIYGVDAATAQSMSTNLTLAKNFAQLMAQAGSDSSNTMKDVAGIKVVAETRDQQTGQVTKGHVEVVGDFVSQEGYVNIEALPENDSYGGSGSAIIFGKDTSEYRMHDIYIGAYTVLSGGQRRTNEGTIELQYMSRAGGGSTSIRSVAYITPRMIAAEGFGIIRGDFTTNYRDKIRLANYDTIDTMGWKVLRGVGTPDNPVSFTVDGVTLTVIGGLIVDVSQ